MTFGEDSLSNSSISNPKEELRNRNWIHNGMKVPKRKNNGDFSGNLINYSFESNCIFQLRDPNHSFPRICQK